VEGDQIERKTQEAFPLLDRLIIWNKFFKNINSNNSEKQECSRIKKRNGVREI